MIAVKNEAAINFVRQDKNVAVANCLRNLLDSRKSDPRVVTRIDRLARRIADLATIVRELEATRLVVSITALNKSVTAEFPRDSVVSIRTAHR